MLTKEELELLEGMLKREDVKGKRQIRQLIYFNTVKPKYDVGDYVKYSCKNNYVYNNPVRDFVGKIVDVHPCYEGLKNSEKYILYRIEYTVQTEDGEVHTSEHYSRENEITGLTKKTINKIKKNGKYQDSMSL